jgi:periplasmic divalent cation tolerance protein
MTDKVVAYSTCGSAEEARRIALHLVERRVAACVNILPGIHSVYRWKGAIEEAAEWMLIIKTRRSLVQALGAELRKVHSYEVPELVALTVVDGLEPYLDWIDEETGTPD